MKRSSRVLSFFLSFCCAGAVLFFTVASDHSAIILFLSVLVLKQACASAWFYDILKISEAEWLLWEFSYVKFGMWNTGLDNEIWYMEREEGMTQYKTRVAYRTVGPNKTAGNLSCGFIYKPDDRGSNRDITFEYYGGLLLLDGEGEYSDRSHACVKLSRGSFVQRLPGVKHSTIVKPDGKWLEFFICISAESYHNLFSMGLLSDRRGK